jgi:hypothetical protein
MHQDVSTLQRQLLHLDVSIKQGSELHLAVSIKQGSELHLDVSIKQGSEHLDVSRQQETVLVYHVYTIGTWAEPGRVYTTEAIAAPGRVWTTGDCAGLPCLHHRDLGCTRTCLHKQRPLLHMDVATKHRGLSCTWTSLEKKSLS